MKALKIALFAGVLGFWANAYAGSKIEGVWQLESFTFEENGVTRSWCEGSHGYLAYIDGTVFVAINCRSNLSKSVFYTGTYHLDGSQVVHEVRNARDETLIGQSLRRLVRMSDAYHLELSGPLGDGGIVRVSWNRVEEFTLATPLSGVYRLARSSNEFEGCSGVPYCTGVYGTILYTPGGFTAVALNCQPKADPLQTEPADVHGRKYFYFGRYTAQNDVIRATLENASVVTQIGETAERTMELKGSQLTLTGTNGSAFIAVWEK